MNLKTKKQTQSNKVILITGSGSIANKHIKISLQLNFAVLVLINSDIEKLKPLWIKVSVIRNKMFGHRTNTMDHDGIWEEANVTPNQFKQLIDDSKKILNDLTSLWNRSGHAFNLSATKDTVDLLEDLKRLREDRL